MVAVLCCTADVLKQNFPAWKGGVFKLRNPFLIFLNPEGFCVIFYGP